MKPEEYIAVQNRVMLIAHFCLETEGLDEMLAAIEKADAIGALVDPTLWMRGGEKMQIIGEIAKGVRAIKRIVEKHHDRIVELEAREAARA